jgi:hypothetical protein
LESLSKKKLTNERIFGGGSGNREISSGVQQSHRDFISMNNFSEQENLHGMNDLDNMLLEELEEASDSETEDLLTRIILNRPRRHAHSFSVEIPRFDLGDYSDEECVNLFRFTTTQLAELIHSWLNHRTKPVPSDRYRGPMHHVETSGLSQQMARFALRFREASFGTLALLY